MGIREIRKQFRIYVRISQEIHVSRQRENTPIFQCLMQVSTSYRSVCFTLRIVCSARSAITECQKRKKGIKKAHRK